MNLLTHHLEHPTPTFAAALARTEARLGAPNGLPACLRKFFCDEPPARGPTRAEIDALIATNVRLRMELAAEILRGA